MWAQAFFPQTTSPPPDDPPDGDEEEEEVPADIVLTDTLQERCLQSLQRLTDIAQQETISQQDLAHLMACLDTAEEKYADLISDSSQEMAERVGEETQEQEQQPQELMQEQEQGEEEEPLVEGFEAGSIKRMRVETDCVKTGNIEVAPEPIFLHMFVEAAEIVYRNQETLNQGMVAGEIPQEMVACEIPQEMVVSAVHQDMITSEVQS